MSVPLGYEKIKALAKELDCKIEDLLVLARTNDPFLIGSPANIRDGEWFAEWFYRVGYEGKTGVHLRGVHYRLVSQRELPIMPAGAPYLNTLECWRYLGTASKAARILGMVDVESFEDHRNPEPVIYADPLTEAQQKLEYYWREWGDHLLPKISVGFDAFQLPLPKFQAVGYDYQDAYQPYHIEFFIEKSTQDGVLHPLCRQHIANFVTSKGFQSISSTIALLRRAERHGKPSRVFYISDFDPAGDAMAVAVARQIEFWKYVLKIDAEIKLQPLVLTRDQVIKYQLPSIPIKESDRRVIGFRERYGLEAAELDALEALQPGTLTQIIEEAIAPYRDSDLEDKWWDTREEADAVAEAAQEWVIRDSKDEITTIETEIRAIQDRYRDQVTALSTELQLELEPYRERIEAIRHDIQSAIALVNEIFDVPEKPESDLAPDDEDWLFDSERSYSEQLGHYKARRQAQNGAAELSTEEDCQ